MFTALSQGELKGLARTGDAPGAGTTLCAGTQSGYPSCWSLRLEKYRRTQAGATSLAKVASIAFCLPGERVDGRYDVRLDGRIIRAKRTTNIRIDSHVSQESS